MGNIGEHRVVATKLSAIGHTREAMIAAGSITTRLLGKCAVNAEVFAVGIGFFAVTDPYIVYLEELR